MSILNGSSGDLTGWQKSLFEHGPTWTLVVGSLFLLFSLFPVFLEAKKYKRTFTSSQRFFVLWGIGSLFLAGNAIAFFFRDVVNKKDWTNWMAIAKYGSFGLTNIVAALLNFYAFTVKRRNVIEAAKLGISEEAYWTTVIKKSL